MSRFVINTDDTVTDTTTGLTWSRATNAKDKTFKEAEQVITDLGGGWRLPTVEELFQLADRTKINPAIDTDAFPDTAPDWYWSSTPCAWNASAVWVVYFGLGDAHGYRRNGGACVRAVRVSPAGQ